MDVQAKATATRGDDGSVTLTTTTILSAATVAALLATTAAGSGTVATGGTSAGTGQQASGSTGSAPAAGTSSGGASSGTFPSSLVAVWYAPDVVVAADGSATWTDRVGGLVAKASAAVGAALKDGAVQLAGKGAFVTAGIGKIPVGSDSATVVVIGDNEGGAAVAYGNPAPHAWRKVGAWQGGKFYLSDYDFNPEVPQQLAPVGGGVHEVRVDFGAKQAAATIDGKAFGPWTMLFQTVADKLYLGGSASGEYMTGSLKCVMVFDGTIQGGDPDKVKAALGISSASSTTTAPSGSSGGTSAGQSSGSSGTGTSGTASGSPSAGTSTSGSSQGSTPSGSTGSGTASTGQGSTSGAGSNPTSGSQSSTGQGSTTPSGSGTAPTTGNSGNVTGGVVGNGTAASPYDPANNDVASVQPTADYLAAAKANNLGTIRATPVDCGSSVQVTAPFHSFRMNFNQIPKYLSHYTAYSDVPTPATDKYMLSGTWTGAIKNVEVQVDQDKPYRAAVNSDGTWTCGPIDLTGKMTGPVSLHINAWDALPGGVAKVQLNMFYMLLVDNPAVPNGRPDMPAWIKALRPNAKEVFYDDFEGKESLDNYQLGLNARNEPWGSDSMFVRRTDPQYMIDDAYQFPIPGWIRLRCLRDEALKAYTGWTTADQASNEPDHWRTALLCTGWTPPAGGKSALGKGMISKGLIWLRERQPEGLGTWTSTWSVNAGHVPDGSGAGEIDWDEASVWGDSFQYGGLTCHDWNGDANHQVKDNSANAAGTVRTLTGGAVRSMQNLDWVYVLNETDVEVWLNGQCMGTRPRPTLPAADDPYYVMIDMPMGGGWPYDIPPSGYYDRYLDFVALYQG